MIACTVTGSSEDICVFCDTHTQEECPSFADVFIYRYFWCEMETFCLLPE